MDESKKTIVSLKEAVYTGIILDFLILAFTSIIMDGGFIFSITIFLVIAHWIGNTAILFSKKGRQSKAGKDFIRFGIFPLILVTFVARCILGFLGIRF